MKDHKLAIIIGIIMVLLYWIGFAYGRASAPEPPETTTTIVIPTCTELDNIGYDGLATCINEEGDPVTPGTN